MKRFVLVAAVASLLAACATTSPDVVSYRDAQRAATVHDGVVLNIRPVRVDGSQSGIGAMAGSVAGGVAGSSVGGYRDGFAVGVLGAVVGGVIGNAVERSGTSESADEIIVRLNNGQRKAYVQAHGSESLREGDAVLVIDNGRRARITRAPASSGSSPPAAPSSNAPSNSTAPASPANRAPAYVAPGDPTT